MLSCLNKVSSEPRNVFMDSTFSELFYFISISERDAEPEKAGKGG